MEYGKLVWAPGVPGVLAHKTWPIRLCNNILLRQAIRRFLYEILVVEQYRHVDNSVWYRNDCHNDRLESNLNWRILKIKIMNTKIKVVVEFIFG